LLYAVARRLQKPTLQRLSAVGLAVAGIAMMIGVVGPGTFRLDPIGVMAALLAAFSFAFYNIGGHGILARYDRWTVLLYTTCSASLFWIVINPPWKIVAAHYSGGQWAVAVPAGLLVDFSTRSVFVLLRGITASGAYTGSCGQLPGTGVLDRDRGISAGRDSPANTNDRNRDCTGGDHRGAVAGSEVS